MNISQTSYKERLSSLCGVLQEKGIDAAWIMGPENRRYLSGFRAEDSHPTESSGSLLISKDLRILITDSRFTAQAQQETSGFEIVTAKEGIASTLSELAEKRGMSVLGFEDDYVSWALYQKVSKALPENVRLEPMARAVEGLRTVKSKEELDILAASARLISVILDETIKGLRVGDTEKEIASRIETMARERGADCLSFPPIVASGPNSALPHAIPSERRISPGEPVLLDVGVRLKGYCSDITRTVFLGEPSRDFIPIYLTVRAAQKAALAKIREGIYSNIPDAEARNLIAKAGYGDFFGHSLGHGIGLAAHEDPRLSPRNPVLLKAGTVVTVEPGIYLPGRGGVRLEEMVLVKEDGCSIMTTEPHIFEDDYELWSKGL